MPADITLNPDVVSSTLEGGGVLLDLSTKQYFAVNQSALAVWQHLEDGGTLGGIYAAVGPDHAADVTVFATALVTHGLALHSSDRVDVSHAAPPDLPRPWNAPSVTPHGRPLSQVILSPFDPTVPIPE